MLDLGLDEEPLEGLDASRAQIAAAVAAGMSRATIDRMARRLGVAWGITWTGAVQVLDTDTGEMPLW